MGKKRKRSKRVQSLCAWSANVTEKEREGAREKRAQRKGATLVELDGKRRYCEKNVFPLRKHDDTHTHITNSNLTAKKYKCTTAMLICIRRWRDSRPRCSELGVGSGATATADAVTKEGYARVRNEENQCFHRRASTFDINITDEILLK